MNVIEKLFFLLLCFVVPDCVVGKEQKYIRMSDKIVAKYIKDMKREYRLNCIGSGGEFLERVNRINLYFETLGSKNRDEIRILLIMATEKLLKKLIGSELNDRRYRSIHDNRRRIKVLRGDAINVLIGQIA